MSDNYAVINGKRVELTDEQVKAISAEIVEMKINPFNRMGLGSYYYVPHYDGTARTFTEDNGMTDTFMHLNSNYINDFAFAKQIALHQLLYRKLLKFAYDNECEDNQAWDCENRHYHVYYSHAYKIFTVELNYEGKHPGVYFPSPEAAKRAIKEVIEPFMKEHPDFVW
jgi:hypothetical protein